MDITTSFIIIAVAALTHATFQLSISMLTLLSSHTIGSKRSHSRLLMMTSSFLGGVTAMTVLLLSFASILLTPFAKGHKIPELWWIAACGLLTGLGLAVWIFYYRRQAGTELWLPRNVAKYLTGRARATKHTAEAFTLGMSSVVAELLFIVTPLFVTALILVQLTPLLQLAGVLLYAAISMAPLAVITGMIGAGHSISRIQRWREENKHFLQFIAGSMLVALGFYLYVSEVMTPTVMAAAGAF